MMNALGFFETSLTVDKYARRKSLKDMNLQRHCSKNHKSRIVTFAVFKTPYRNILLRLKC